MYALLSCRLWFINVALGLLQTLRAHFFNRPSQPITQDVALRTTGSICDLFLALNWSVPPDVRLIPFTQVLVPCCVVMVSDFLSFGMRYSYPAFCVVWYYIFPCLHIYMSIYVNMLHCHQLFLFSPSPDSSCIVLLPVSQDNRPPWVHLWPYWSPKKLGDPKRRRLKNAISLVLKYMLWAFILLFFSCIFYCSGPLIH